MSNPSNIKHYKECGYCHSLAFGKQDKFCSQCGSLLPESESFLTGIRDYAYSLLKDFLIQNPETAQEVIINKIPDIVTETIRVQGYVEFSTYTSRHILAECWNEVEIALDYWRGKTGLDIHATNIGNLHVFCIVCFVEMLWHKATFGMIEGRLTQKTLAESLYMLDNV